jgi:hypothetical protein
MADEPFDSAVVRRIIWDLLRAWACLDSELEHAKLSNPDASLAFVQAVATASATFRDAEGFASPDGKGRRVRWEELLWIRAAEPLGQWIEEYRLGDATIEEIQVRLQDQLGLRRELDLLEKALATRKPKPRKPRKAPPKTLQRIRRMPAEKRRRLEQALVDNMVEPELFKEAWGFSKGAARKALKIEARAAKRVRFRLRGKGQVVSMILSGSVNGFLAVRAAKDAVSRVLESTKDGLERGHAMKEQQMLVAPGRGDVFQLFVALFEISGKDLMSAASKAIMYERLYASAQRAGVHDKAADSVRANFGPEPPKGGQSGQD